MTTYGTIPSSAGESSPVGFISRAKERGRSALATRRPWRELVHIHAFSLPPSLGEAYLRIRTNATYFAMNYVIVVLVVVFLSLLWHPISLIVFLFMMAVWLFLYFLRDEPVVIRRRPISDRYILIGLSVVTLAVLLLTNATANILISLLIGLVVVLVHAALRKNDDLFLEEEAAGLRGWYVAAGDAGRPLSGVVGLQSGWSALRRAAIPEIWGQDMDVPDIALKRTLRVSDESFEGDRASLKAAIIFTPGATISGCKEHIYAQLTKLIVNITKKNLLRTHSKP